MLVKRITDGLEFEHPTHENAFSVRLTLMDNIYGST